MAQTLPHPDHIIILIEENQANSQVIGNAAHAPYINQLTTDSIASTFTKMYAIEHPSQPNYFDFFAGSNQGVTDDNVPSGYPYTTANLARELLDKGLSFVTYSQDLPSVGSDVASSGSYVRKHNPLTNWVGTGTNQVPDTLNQPYTAFPSDFSMLPTVCYVVPNEDSDMHNGFGNPAIAAGDFWFKEHLQSLVNWVANPVNNSLLIYTFDEDEGLAGNNIPTVFYGPMVKAGTDVTQYNLYNMLRTIEDIYGTGHAGSASSALPILDCWRAPVSTGLNQISEIPAIQVFPNPAASTIQFTGAALNEPGSGVIITDITGRQLGYFTSGGSKKLVLNVSDYSNGLYIYQLQNGERNLQSGKFTVTH